MTKTYLNLYYHLIFAVKYRNSAFYPAIQNRVYSYIRSIFNSKGHSVIQIGGMEDHIHILFCARDTTSLSDIVREVKACSAKWMNDQGIFKCRFSWQRGYGAFTVSQIGIERVINYIKNQEFHHLKKPFLVEIREMLRLCGKEETEPGFNELE